MTFIHRRSDITILVHLMSVVDSTIEERGQPDAFKNLYIIHHLLITKLTLYGFYVRLLYG